MLADELEWRRWPPIFAASTISSQLMLIDKAAIIIKNCPVATSAKRTCTWVALLGSPRRTLIKKPIAIPQVGIGTKHAKVKVRPIGSRHRNSAKRSFFARVINTYVNMYTNRHSITKYVCMWTASAHAHAEYGCKAERLIAHCIYSYYCAHLFKLIICTTYQSILRAQLITKWYSFQAWAPITYWELKVVQSLT